MVNAYFFFKHHWAENIKTCEANATFLAYKSFLPSFILHDKSLSFQALIQVLGSNFIRQAGEQETVLFL